MREPRKIYSHQELRTLRDQLYQMERLEGHKTLQIKEKTDAALLEIGRRLHITEDKTYDIIITHLIEEYLKTHKGTFEMLPTPNVFSTSEAEEVDE